MIYVAKRYGLFGGNKFINWASNQGLLSSLAHELYDITIMNFDKYIEPKLNSISQDQLMKRKRKRSSIHNCRVKQRLMVLI